MEAQARLAPRLQALRSKHAGQPDLLQRELTALRKSEGASMFGGFLPMLLQWPFLTVMYLVFRSPVIGGARNSLLSHNLFGAPLGGHWLGGGGPLSAQGAVFAGLFVLLAGLGWLSARMTRRFAGTGEAPAAVAPASGPPPSAPPGSGAAASGAAASGAAAAVARLVPYLTVVVAAFLPLAAGLYLVTTTAWTLAERRILRGRDHHP
jgi:YidC/Oxa1 family membrane protein insertase